jgi:DNA-binding LacI/PurR family transcriptional regulator
MTGLTTVDRSAHRAPAIKDVARLAGVSHQTVSRVLNAHPNVRDVTRARVQTAIAELGYRPNLAARALVTGSTHTVGVVAQNTTLFGPASTLSAVESAAALRGFGVTVSSLSQLDRASITDAVQRHAEQRVAGIVLLAPVESANAAIDYLRDDLPIVAIDGDPQRSTGLVTVDQAFGAHLATQHLLDAGHATVWHVSGPDQWFDSAHRIKGWRATLERAGARVPPVISSDWSPASGYHAGQLLAEMPEVTAVFAANDHIALGLTKAMREAGRRIPEDLSLVGFDDIVEAAYFTPPLTTIRPDFAQLGRAALELLVRQMESGGPLPAPAPLRPTLIERRSVAPYSRES